MLLLNGTSRVISALPKDGLAEMSVATGVKASAIGTSIQAQSRSTATALQLAFVVVPRYSPGPSPSGPRGIVCSSARHFVGPSTM